MKFTIRNLIKKVFLAPVLFLSFSVNSAAQGTSPADTLSVELDEIKVEAVYSSVSVGRAPLSVSFLNRNQADLTSRPAATMDELTFTLPGVWVSNRENNALGERMTIRGMGWRSQFGVRGVQVILDDIPLTVADGQTVMNMVDPAMVQSLELLRGPSATFWGNSSGGVLFMRTRPAADAPSISYRGYMGSYNTLKQELRWNHQSEKIRWNAYGTYYNTNGFRDYSSAELIRSGISAGFNIGSRSNVEARVAYAGMPYAENPGSLNKQDAENEPTKAWPFNVSTQSGKEFHQIMSSVRFIHDFENGVLSVLGHGTYRDLKNPVPGPFILVDRLAGGLRTTYDVNNLPFDFQIGGELKWQNDDREQRNNDGGSPGEELTIDQTDNVEVQALFAQSNIEFGSFSMNTGIRADRMVFSVDDFLGNNESSRTFTTINPSVGLIYNFGNLRWYSNFSTSFEAPTTTEFKNRLGPDGTILTGFNPDLDPEKTTGIETGFRGQYQPLNLSFDVTAFIQFVRDQIIQETEIDGQAIFSNGGNAEHVGIESQFRIQPTAYFSLDMMYTWVNAEFSGGNFDMGEVFKGNKIPGVSPHRFGASASIYVGSNTFSTDVKWVGEYYADSANTALNDSYFLTDMRWTYNGLDFNSWKVHPFIAVDNIFNTRYNTSVALNNNFGRFFEPGSDRAFRAGLRLDIF